MFQKSLAVLLMSSWISFSGANLVEDLSLDLPRQASLHSPGKEFLPAVAAANDVPASEALRRFDHPTIFELRNVSWQHDGPMGNKKFTKIHKVLRVFLI
jgi:hypothetical protein